MIGRHEKGNEALIISQMSQYSRSAATCREEDERGGEGMIKELRLAAEKNSGNK